MILTAAVLALGANGCSRPERQAKPTTGYVSLERLAKGHPLWGEVGRLETAAAEMRRLTDPVPTQGASGSTLSLSPLILPALPPVDLTGERARLQGLGERHLAEFGERLGEQQRRALDTRRMELEAVQRARRAQRLRDAWIEVASRSLALRREDAEILADLAARVTNLEVRINTLQARIAMVPPPPRRSELEEMIAAHRAELAPLRQRLLELDPGARAQREVELRLAEADRQDERETQQLLAERDAELRRTTATLIATQRRTLEEELTRLSGADYVQTRGTTVGPYVIESPVESAGARSIPLSAALKAIERQRSELLGYIRADVRASVQDAAEVRNIRVRFDRPASGIPDMTEQFRKVITDNLPEESVSREDQTT